MDTLKLLVAEGANIDYENRLGHTALIAAVVAAQRDAALYVLSHGAAPDRVNRHGHTALSMAASHLEEPDLIVTLLEAGGYTRSHFSST